jgi:hypothetical protein
MKKKTLLIGTIATVILLVFVSFSSVVGFQTKIISSTKTSPLFSVRTKRAIDERRDALPCKYLGKGKESVSSISTRKNQIGPELVDKIKNMNSEIFNRFKILVIKQARQDINLKNKDIGELIDELNQLREEPEILKYADSSYTDKPILCFIFDLFEFLVFILLSILENINTSCSPTQCTEMCGPTCPPQITCEPEYCLR